MAVNIQEDRAKYPEKSACELLKKKKTTTLNILRLKKIVKVIKFSPSINIFNTIRPLRFYAGLF